MSEKRRLNLFTRLKREGITVDGSQCFISEWDVVRYIDRGMFGVVYEIVKNNKKLGEQHSALKIIELDEKSIEKYRDEIAALSSVRNHPHGVSIEDFSELHLDEGDFVRRYVLIRMELLKPMPKNGMPEADVIDMALAVSEVLADCHSQKRKILHCDIKPQNILLTDNGQYKLSDFGEAKFLDRTRGESGMRGTPLYMSPEMWHLKGYDERSDLYSLGVTMYSMLNGGCVPFYSPEMGEEGKSEAIRRRLAGEKFPRIKGVRPELLRIINKLCEIDPNKRYQRAILLNRDLKAFVQKREDERIRKEKAEAESRLRAIRKAEAAKKREEEKQRREDERRKREAETAAAQAALLEKQNETLLLGETVSAEQRGQMSQESVLSGGSASTITANKVLNNRVIRIAAAVLCITLLTGAAIAIGSAVRHQQEAKIAEEMRLEQERLEKEEQERLVPKTNADRALAEEFSFEWTGDGCQIIGYKGNGGEVSIPDSYNGYPVVSIGEGAFKSNKTITSVYIPHEITNIGAAAFHDCTNLTSVTIPDSITLISSRLFYHCAKLTSISIPKNVTAIGNEAFYACGITSIDFPENVSSIGSRAFMYCAALKSLTIPSNVINIGEEAFSFCRNISSLTILDGLESIEYRAFYNCGSLTDVTIPGSVKTLKNGAFGECTNLASVTLLDGVTNIGSAFSDCNKLASIAIPNSVTRIGNNAFYGCDKLTSLTIPDSVTSIGEFAFCGCAKLTAITIPDGVTSIGDGAFNNCRSITAITIPDGVTRIGDQAFFACDKLTSITIPDSVTSIGDEAFAFCSKLVSITIPNSVTSIGKGAFSGCGSLTSITIPDSVTSIGDEAFAFCSKLVSITIPNSVTSIGANAFRRAYSTYYYDGTLADNRLFPVITITAPHEASYYGYTPGEKEEWLVTG